MKMDAYDIFKKLTKGLTFKHRVLGVKNNNNTPKPQKLKKEEELQVKKEECSVHDESDFNQSGSDSENDQSGNNQIGDDQLGNNQSGDDQSDNDKSVADQSDNEADLQLVKGVKVGPKKRKKKKKEMTEDLKKKLEIEEENRFRNLHSIKVVGRHVPAALQDFSELMFRYQISQSLVDIVKQCGYDDPTPVQRQALPCMLEDRQILACAPTGSGKTAAFLLPVLHSLGAPQGGPRALVLCPTRELAHQIYREGLRLSAGTQLRVSVLKTVKESKVKEREATIRKSDIVISTPNRLCYLLNQDNVGISLEKVHWLIIDEADKMFEGSPEEQSAFRQQLEQIMAATGQRHRRVAMFSATHTPAVAGYCRTHLKGLINITVGHRNTATDLVEQELLYCGNEQGKLIAFRGLVQKGLKPPVLVFVQSKERAKQLFKELLYDGINVDAIHSDRTQAQRDNVVRSFRTGRIWVLICTELMGRGIDFRGVNLVINYDFPPSAIAYIHRVGRAGRAGQRGRAVTFFTQDDVANLRSIASVMKQSGCNVPQYMLSLKQNPNIRKIRRKKAPSREQISTVLQKPIKRKLDENPEQKDEKPKDTPAVKGGKNRKQRKIQHGGQKEHKKHQDGRQKEHKKHQDGRQKFNKNNRKSKENKKLLKKNKKKVLVKKVKNKS